MDGSRTVGVAAPTITAVAVTSTPQLETDTYGAGETIRFAVTFSAAVTVTGDPQFAFSLGNSGAARRESAAYDAGLSTTTMLVFGYTVQATDEDDNGIFLLDKTDTPPAPVELDADDAIVLAADASVSADLDYTGRRSEANHKVDGSRAATTPAPTTSDATITISQDTAYTFEASDFNFADDDTGDTLDSVRVVTLPDAGGLTLNGRVVTLNQVVSRGDIDADRLVFTPAPNANGSPYTTFSFKVSDGTNESEAATMTINVLEGINQPSTITAYWRESDPENRSVQIQAVCGSTETFRGYWLPPVKSIRNDVSSYKVPDEWEAAVTAEHGASNVSYTIQNSADIAEYPEITGRVGIDGYSKLTIRVRGRFGLEGWGSWSPSVSLWCNTADSAPQTANTLATGTPGISGTPRVGETLTATTDRIADEDGLTGAAFTYQWIRHDLTTTADTDIDGATGQTYTMAEADDGHGIKVRVTFTDDAGHRESLTSNTVVAAPAQNAEPDPLTASFESMPETHDGTAFTFRLVFSEAISTSYTVVRDQAFDVTAGSVTNARRVDGRSDLWAITITPDGDDVTVALPATTDCAATGAICTSDGRRLSHARSQTVRASRTPFLASFAQAPDEHVGDPFTLQLELGKNAPGLSYRTVRDHLLGVTNGTVTKAKRRTKGSNQSWTVTIDPDSSADVRVVVRTANSCDEAHAVCTANGQLLTGDLRLTVDGPASLSVANAEVEEASGATLDFVVTLSRRRFAATTVQYATADGTATAGTDYTAVLGTLTFARLETSKTVSVPVLVDAHDEGEETLTLTLTGASGATIGDGTATGTIVNHDPLPRALLARFGRTAAVHVVEHVEERLQAPREPGVRGRFAGRELRRGMERDIALSVLTHLSGGVGGHPGGEGLHDAGGSPPAGSAALGMPGLAAGRSMAAGAPVASAAGPMAAGVGSDGGVFTGRGLLQAGLGGGDVLTGSAFALNRETGHGGILSFWSRGAQGQCSGREGALALGGRVRTTMVGADYATGPLVAGLSLSHSRGLGEYTGVTAGRVASAVTGLYPWLGYRATDRITVWGVAGYGWGGLLLTPDGGPALKSGLSMAMAAAGTRGELVAGGAGGVALAFKADALWVGTATDGVDGPAGRLAATTAAVSRFRTGLEGSRDYALAGRLSLRPMVEVGLRHDSGDAETGAGMDIGGGLLMSDTATGLAVDVRVRTLVVHQAAGFAERGMAVSLSYNPTPSTPLGLTARVAPSWGGQATSGAEALWGRETMTGMAAGGVAQGTRLDGEVGYGLPVGSRFVGTPRVGFGTSEYGRDYRLGYSLGVLDRQRLDVELGVDAHRRESPLQGGASTGALGRATVRW